MILGCDVGTGYTKAVVMEGDKFLFGARVATEANPDRALEKVLSEVRNKYGNDVDQKAALVITGWGESKISRPHQSEPVIKCISKAAIWAQPSCKTMLCLGAQQSLAMNINSTGRVLQYRVNDKCAAGAGRFLEIICEAMECKVEETADIAAKADKQIKMSSQCAVFGESEVVSLVNDGESVANIVDSILRALTQNIITLCKRIKMEEIILVSGGLANNARMVALLREALPMRMQVFEPQPDYVCAIGAALCANGGGL